MTYHGLKDTVNRAWDDFIARLNSETGCCGWELHAALDRKDVFNGAMDAVMDVVDLEYSDDE